MVSFSAYFFIFKNKDSINKELESIVDVQILLMVALSVALIASPFIYKRLTLFFEIFYPIIGNYLTSISTRN
jgi:hypothetical protein